MPTKRQAQKQITQILEDIARDVAALPDRAIADLMPVIHAARRDAELAYDAWITKHGVDGAERFTAKRYRQLIRELTSTERAIKRRRRHPKWSSRLQKQMQAALQSNHHSILATSQANLLSEMSRIPMAIGANVPAQSSIATMSSLVSLGEHNLTKNYRLAAGRYAKHAWPELRRQLAIGVAKRESVDEMTRRLVRISRGRRQNPVGAVFTRLEYWAERVVRTETIAAYNEVHLHDVKALAAGDDGVRKRWDASLDSRLCVICRDLHGEVRKPDEPFSDGSMRSPAHPNCRCAVTTWHVDWPDDL